MPDSPIGKLLTATAALTDEVQALKIEVGSLRESIDETKEIVGAWEAVKVGGKFIKWLGGIATAIAALWFITRTGLAHFVLGSKQ